MLIVISLWFDFLQTLSKRLLRVLSIFAAFRSDLTREAIQAKADHGRQYKPMRQRLLPLSRFYQLLRHERVKWKICKTTTYELPQVCRRAFYWRHAAWVDSFRFTNAVWRSIRPTLHDKRGWIMQGADHPTVFNTDFEKIGILICYDVELPELARLQSWQKLRPILKSPWLWISI